MRSNVSLQNHKCKLLNHKTLTVSVREGGVVKPLGQPDCKKSVLFDDLPKNDKKAIVTNSHAELPYIQTISLMDYFQEAGREFSREGESSLNN